MPTLSSTPEDRQTNFKPNRTLHWVKFIEQENGSVMDAYVLAKSLKQIEETFADILEIKVIKEVMEL